MLPCAVVLSPQHVCKYACSEEVPEPVDVGGEGFCVAFDPLDGSSIVDTNFAVGTIFGVWPGDKLKGITGREQVGGQQHPNSGLTWVQGRLNIILDLRVAGCSSSRNSSFVALHLTCNCSLARPSAGFGRRMAVCSGTSDSHVSCMLY